jgi:hypothetical protein
MILPPLVFPGPVDPVGGPFLLLTVVIALLLLFLNIFQTFLFAAIHFSLCQPATLKHYYRKHDKRKNLD